MKYFNDVKPLLIRKAHIIDPASSIDCTGNILIVEGKVSSISPKNITPAPIKVGEKYCEIDAEGLILVPGFIDLHCHLREPGEEEKETIATGTLAAARGGFTSICCMPNTNPPADCSAIINFINKKSASVGTVKVFPIGCITKGRKGKELAEMGELAEAGCVAFSDDGRPVMNSRLMRNAMEYSLLFNLPLIDHCEDILLSSGGVMNEGVISTRLGLRGIPSTAEEVIVARDIFLSQLTGARVHITHISTVGSVELMRYGKDKGLNITCDVTPHHLTLDETVLLNFDTNAKVNPPLRTRSDITALIGALNDGTIDAIATDHAPHTIVDKQCEFDNAAFGISGFETAIASLLSLVHEGRVDIKTIISALTAGAIKVLSPGISQSLYNSPIPEGLGLLKPGSPADLVLLNMNEEWTIDPEQFVSKGKNTPLGGKTLKGKIKATVINGQIVYKDYDITITEY